VFSVKPYPASNTQMADVGVNPEGILSAFVGLTTRALMGFL
jgi:hypothetical protein